MVKMATTAQVHEEAEEIRQVLGEWAFSGIPVVRGDGTPYYRASLEMMAELVHQAELDDAALVRHMQTDAGASR